MQTVVARSSTEAEYRSMTLVAVEVTWILSLLSELKDSHASPVILCDTSTVALAHNPVLHSWSKHMELDLFFVREKVHTNLIQVVHIPDVDQCADILTKAHTFHLFCLQRQAQSAWKAFSQPLMSSRRVLEYTYSDGFIFLLLVLSTTVDSCHYSCKQLY